MSGFSVVIKGTGIVSALGINSRETLYSIQQRVSGIKPLTHFVPLGHGPLPVGEANLPKDTTRFPSRTHQLARHVADQAMAGSLSPPDAVVFGVTTGGMDTTENNLKSNNHDPMTYSHHALSTVSKDISDHVGCTGPALTVSTACSSGAAALLLAAKMVQSGRFKRVLAGGVDAICRLTYYGFKSLQLIDPEGSKPLDKDRKGMSVAEGAAALLLEAGDPPAHGIQILGGGLSCDSFHPAKPHPRGEGAFAAMKKALFEAGISESSVDYINLHGTGTADNDYSELTAIHRMFGEDPPPLSSIKGATGHSLAASGAIEAVVSCLCLDHGILPANIGCEVADPELGIVPVMAPVQDNIDTVLSNSFGFGGNNASLILGKGSAKNHIKSQKPLPAPLKIMGQSLITGAGDMKMTLAGMEKGDPCKGRFDLQSMSHNLPPGVVRRLKRLSIMALSLADNAFETEKQVTPPVSVFFGTGLGALSETDDFLSRLFSTEEKFPSPTDFIGSVHNAAAGQVAMRFGAKGANITTSGDDDSFEQALFAADLLHENKAPFLVMAADEGHEKLSNLIDHSVAPKGPLSDGGGALVLARDEDLIAPVIQLVTLRKNAYHTDDAVRLAGEIFNPEKEGGFCLILAGIPEKNRVQGEKQLDAFIHAAGYTGPVVDYRRLFGEFQSVSAVAAALATRIVEKGVIFKGLCGERSERTHNKSLLILGFGTHITAVRVDPS